MKFTKAVGFAAILVVGLAAWSQEFPRAELGLDYSYVRYAPSASYTKGHSLNGGGGSATININSYLGIRLDLQGFGSNHTAFNIASNATFPGGLHGDVQGNLFTYLFGPQIKVRAHGFQPFGELLFGGAHSNVYQDAFVTLCQRVTGGCGVSRRPASDAFAMEFGGGVDIPINHIVSFRPGGDRLYANSIQQPVLGTKQSEQFSLLCRNSY